MLAWPSVGPAFLIKRPLASPIHRLPLFVCLSLFLPVNRSLFFYMAVVNFVTRSPNYEASLVELPSNASKTNFRYTLRLRIHI